MKTPWSDLLHYGVGVATVIVLILMATGLLFVVGIAVLIAKLLVFIR